MLTLPRTTSISPETLRLERSVGRGFLPRIANPSRRRKRGDLDKRRGAYRKMEGMSEPGLLAGALQTTFPAYSHWCRAWYSDERLPSVPLRSASGRAWSVLLQPWDISGGFQDVVLLFRQTRRCLVTSIHDELGQRGSSEACGRRTNVPITLRRDACHQLRVGQFLARPRALPGRGGTPTYSSRSAVTPATSFAWDSSARPRVARPR